MAATRHARAPCGADAARAARRGALAAPGRPGGAALGPACRVPVIRGHGAGAAWRTTAGIPIAPAGRATRLPAREHEKGRWAGAIARAARRRAPVVTAPPGRPRHAGASGHPGIHAGRRDQ